MFVMAVGHSDDPDTSEALLEILEQCQGQLQGHSPQAGILFSALDYEHQPLLNGILDRYPDLELVGCTSAGEVSSVIGFEQDSVTLSLFYSDEVTFRAGVGRNLSNNPTEITKETFQRLRNSFSHDPGLCLIFPEAVKGIYCEVVEAIAELTQDIPVLGGVAGGDPGSDTHPMRTHQFYQREVLVDAVPMLLMSENIKVSHGHASGWHPIGKTGTINQVKDNIIYEIDHEPALNFYEHYFSTFTPDNAYPLAIFPPEEDRYLLRASFEHDLEKGLLLVGGYVPENSTVRLTSATQDDIIAATQTSFENALQDYPGESPAAALFFTCAWRNWVLGSQTHQEIEILRKQPLGNIPCSGFYTFGEIAPLRQRRETFTHNTTFVTLLFGT